MNWTEWSYFFSIFLLHLLHRVDRLLAGWALGHLTPLAGHLAEMNCRRRQPSHWQWMLGTETCFILNNPAVTSLVFSTVEDPVNSSTPPWSLCFLLSTLFYLGCRYPQSQDTRQCWPLLGPRLLPPDKQHIKTPLTSYSGHRYCLLYLHSVQWVHKFSFQEKTNTMITRTSS